MSLLLPARAAEVIFAQGRVEAQSPSDNEWKKAEKGTQLAIGDIIRTARNSVAEVALDPAKKNTIRIEPRTVVTLNSGAAGTVDRLDLARGKVYANLEDIRTGLTFEVNTPSAVAGVRGSSYSVYVERDSDEIVAFKDTVFIRAYNADKELIAETMLPEGFKTLIERFSEPAVFAQISGREFRHFDNNMEDLSSRIEGRANARAGAEGARQAASKADGEQASVENIGEMAAHQDVVAEQIDDVKEALEDTNTQEAIEERISVPHEPCVSCYLDEQSGQVICPPC